MRILILLGAVFQYGSFVHVCRNCEKNGIEVSVKTAKALKPVIEKGLA
jgi:hypothetical protein